MRKKYSEKNKRVNILLCELNRRDAVEIKSIARVDSSNNTERVYGTYEELEDVSFLNTKSIIAKSSIFYFTESRRNNYIRSTD